MNKERLRQKIKGLRLAMEPRETQIKSRAIAQRLIVEVAWAEVRSLHIYTPIKSLNEVDTAPVLKLIKKNYPKIVVTKQGKSRQLPRPGQKFDLIIVPTLAFDNQCYRLGWGGGWYDRFLAGQPRAVKIGLAFQNGFVAKDLPREPHDIALDKIITEGIISNYASQSH